MNATSSAVSMDMGVLFLSIVGYITMATACPDLCQCNLEYFVYCKRANIGDEHLKSVMQSMPKKVRFLDLGFNKITTLPSGIFSNLPKLEILILASNQISKIPKDAFQNLPSLEELNLRSNRIYQVTSSTWRRIPSLLKLDLSRNYIDYIELKSFVPLTNLTDLSLEQNQIGVLESNTFSGLRSLLTLDLSKNIIQRMANGSFTDLGKLESLDVSNNMLGYVHSGMFSGLRKLKNLNLNVNKIVNLVDMSMSDFHNTLNVLHVCCNNIREIQKNVFINFRNLRELYLDENNISSIAGRAFMGLRVEKLSVSRNKLTALTREMFRQLRGVRWVDFSYNRITSLSTGVFDSFRDSVLVVRLEHNGMTFIHHGHFRRMLRLQCLNLTANSISRIEDDAFHELRDLQDLVLSRNDLDTVTPGMVSCPTLQNLYLICNPLKHFIGFKYDIDGTSPVNVHMNLTVKTVSSDSVEVTWPYGHGSQIYWTLRVKSLDDAGSTTPTKDQYLAPFKTSHVVSRLSPSVEYYICVNPVFVNEGIHIEQCILVRSRVSPVTTDSSILVTEPLTSRGHPRTDGTVVGLVLVLVVLNWAERTSYT